MMRLFGLVMLAAVMVGCSGAGDVLSLDTDALVNNFEASVETEQMLSEFSFEAARGDIDLSQYNYTYTPPQGSTPGTLTIVGGDFNFGSGDLTINFTAEGDGGFVDPYVEDLSDDTNVRVVADVIFNGVGQRGEPLDAVVDVTVTTIQNNANDVVANVTGTFNVSHDEYNVDLVANDVEMTIDLVTGEVTGVVGSIEGTVDVPNFFYDIDFVVNGAGTQLDIAIDAVTTQINYTLQLADL